MAERQKGLQVSERKRRCHFDSLFLMHRCFSMPSFKKSSSAIALPFNDSSIPIINSSPTQVSSITNSLSLSSQWIRSPCPELALQHVSMFIRSMNNEYQIIEPLLDFGTASIESLSFMLTFSPLRMELSQELLSRLENRTSQR